MKVALIRCGRPPAVIIPCLITTNSQHYHFPLGPPLKDMNLTSSIQSQFLNLKAHHSQYPAIDPKAALKGSASTKIIFITGASQGIGQATAVAFAQAGAKAIYITARSEKALRETTARVSKANPETLCEYMVSDVTDQEQVKVSIRDCVAKFGGIDVVDSNAGYLNQWKKIGESDTTGWWKTWEVNLKGTYYVIRYTMSYLIESAKKHSARGSSGGHLILISSIPTVLAKNMPKELHANLVDEPDLAAGFTVWLCSGKADWAKG